MAEVVVEDDTFELQIYPNTTSNESNPKDRNVLKYRLKNKLESIIEGKAQALLISPRILGMSKLIFQISSVLYLSPYDWISEDLYPRLSTSRWRRWAYRVTCFSTFLHLVPSLAYSLLLPMTAVNGAITGLGILVLVIVLLPHTPMFFYPAEFLRFTNNSIYYMTEFQRKHASGKCSLVPPILWMNEWFLFGVGWLVFSNGVAGFSVLYFLPDSAFSTTTVLSNLRIIGPSLKCNWFSTIIDTLFIARIVQVGWCGYMISLNMGPVFYFPAIAILRDLKKGHLFGPLLHDPFLTMRLLLELKILVRSALSTTTWLIGGVQLALMMLTATTIYCALRLQDPVLVVLICMSCGVGLFLLVLVLTTMASVGELSAEVISMLKTRHYGHSALVNRMLRAQKPLWIRIGSFYSYNRHSAVIIIMIIIDKVVAVLLLDR